MSNELLNLQSQTQKVRGPTFSVLTTVYEKTNVEFFRRTARSVLSQHYPNFEWVILAHGPISSALDTALQELSIADARVRVLRDAVNYGPLGGMSRCLGVSVGYYIVPTDADDLLTEDALAVFASAVTTYDEPAMLYSDEDILVGNDCRDPYRRPDWDEVLNLATSYIWHLCAIRRDIAVQVGLYSHDDARWCHDWDTAMRIAAAGHIPVHIPKVLYHWRHHPSSSTNRPDPESGSRHSTKELLTKIISKQKHPDQFEVGEFPIFRGAAEWSVRRRKTNPPCVAGLSLSGKQVEWSAPLSKRISVSRETRVSWARRLLSRHIVSPREGHSVADLRQSVLSVSEPYVAVSAAALPIDDEWFYEAIGLFELHPSVLAVQGPIVDLKDRVVRGGEIFLDDGSLRCPQAQKAYSDAGPFALMHKPHSVAVVPTEFFVCRTGPLARLLTNLDPTVELAGLGIRLGLDVYRSGGVIAYSPLVKSRMFATMIDGHSDELTRLAESVIGVDSCLELGQRTQGAAGFLKG